MTTLSAANSCNRVGTTRWGVVVVKTTCCARI